MEHAPVTTLVVITLLQLCRAQSTSPTPEWYAANDINDTNFSPKPITELFSTETSFSPENPIVVLPPSTRLPSDRGVFSSPQPSLPDTTEPSAVIPLSSIEPPSSPPFLSSVPISTSSQQETTQQETASQGSSTTQQQTSTIAPAPRASLSPSSSQNLQLTPQLSQRNNVQNPVNQSPIGSNGIQPRPMLPPNIQYSLPQLPQMGNRNFNLGQPPNMGQPNYIVLYQPVPQNIQSLPQPVSQRPQQPVSPPMSPTFVARDPSQITGQPVPRSPNVVGTGSFMIPAQRPGQFFPPLNAMPPPNVPNNFPVQQPNGQLRNNQQPNFQPQPNVGQSNIQRPWNNQPLNNQPQPINQPPNNQQPNSQGPVNQQPNNQQPINQPPINQQPLNPQPINQQPFNPQPINQQPFNPQPINQQPFNPQPINQQPINQMPNSFAPSNVPRPRQRNRLNGGNRNRLNGNPTPNTVPCQGSNQSTARQNGTTATQQNRSAVITIRIPQQSRTNFNQPHTITPVPRTITTSKPRRLRPQVNDKNYDRCLNSCRDKKDRICATPDNVVPINPNNLKGFPSMCHMACHNTFRANPIYEKITNGRCGKLRTRIQTVDKNKVRRDELNKSKYTIISNVPGTVVELAP